MWIEEDRAGRTILAALFLLAVLAAVALLSS
jgi:hypothetical protein